MRELPPAFSPKDRAALPFLANEDHNPVFDAFRRRRHLHSRRWGFAVPNLTPSSYLGRILRIFIGLFGTVFLYAFSFRFGLIFLTPGPALVAALIVTFLTLVFITVLIAWAGRASIRLKAMRRIIPRRCAETFTLRGIQNDLIVDLWLSGVTGAAIIEAMVMEGMDGMRSICRRVWLPGFVIMAGGFFLLADVRITTILLSLSLLWLAWESRDLPWWGKLNMMRGVYVQTLIADWRIVASEHSVTKAVRSGFISGLLYASLIFGGVLLFGFTVIGVGILLNYMDNSSWWPLEGWEFLVVCATLMTATLALASRFTIPFLIQREESLLRREIAGANLAFDDYVRKGLLKDPDYLLSSSATQENRAP